MNDLIQGDSREIKGLGVTDLAQKVLFPDMLVPDSLDTVKVLFPKQLEKSVLNGQEIAEKAHDNTKADILKLHGERMTADQKALLESSETKLKLNVYSPEEYAAAFPELDDNVQGHCDCEGNIFIKFTSDDSVSHISTHETMHLCANRDCVESSSEDEFLFVSGLFSAVCDEDGFLLWDRSRGINEGVTEMYTLRELYSRGEETAAVSTTGYVEAQFWAERLESLVGFDVLADAYFDHGQSDLERIISRLDPDSEDAWLRFSENIDLLQYGVSEEIIDAAYADLMDQFVTMMINKEKLEV